MPPPDARFTMANERTFLAWNRTALALVGAGLAVEQLLDASRTARVGLGLPLIVMGGLLAVASYRHWQANEHAMETDRPLPATRLPAIATAGFVALSCGAVVVAVAHAL